MSPQYPACDSEEPVIANWVAPLRRHRDLGNVFSKLRSPIIGALLALLSPTMCASYSVLTHEAIIDAAWEDSIKPVLLCRFPGATPEELVQARAYAYGGSLIQDMGYYPFGSKFFSDLTHYVRSGDFVVALIEESQNLNEYAFALGALSHYAADTSGHQSATNLAVAIMYPKLATQYGSSVTYEDEPSAHMTVEYGFDVDQVAKAHYAPTAFHEFIGFEVSKPVLERAFARTYSLEMSDVFQCYVRLGRCRGPRKYMREDVAIGSYRHAVATDVPRMTKTAWQFKKDEIQSADPSETKTKFIYNISRPEYRKNWGNTYQKPNFFAKVKAGILHVVPKVGPFSGFAYRPPTPAVDQLYMASFNNTLERYRALLLEQKEGRLQLPNDNLDTGAITGAADYRLTDATYAKLLHQTTGKPMPDDLRQNLLSYYADLQKPYATKKKPDAWQALLRELDSLKATPPTGARCYPLR